MENKNFGYVRVSTAEQNEGRQLDALKQYEIPVRDIYIDKVSGKDFNRPEYQRMKSNLRKGDTVVIQSIDRLGRNYNQIKEEWQSISKDLDCHIIVIDMPLLNTTSPNADGLTGKFIADIVLQILAYVAETERESIKKRQSQGISLALNNGVKLVDQK
jgi:DNA invertase Pin-like site-specific DNA recombinase